MGLFREFFTWRKQHKALEALRNSWCRPYEDHPFTAEATCYSPRLNTFQIYESDSDYIKSMLDAYGNREQPQWPFKITYAPNSLVRPEFEQAK